MFDTKEIKNNIIEIANRLYNKGFTSGTSGNISFRSNGQIFITATGTCLGEISEEKIAIVNEEGLNIGDEKIKPSSEYMMHVEIYKNRPEINSIIHAHSTFSTTLAISGETFLPVFLAEPVVLFGKTIPIVKYETPSTLKLAKEVAELFKDNDAAIMANHGATVCGNGLKETFYKFETLEFYSQVYIFSSMYGKRLEIPEEKINELLAFRH